MARRGFGVAAAQRDAARSLIRLSAAENQPDVRRMVALCAPLGIHTPNLFPTTAGKDYEVTPYLEPLQKLRNKFTVISASCTPMLTAVTTPKQAF